MVVIITAVLRDIAFLASKLSFSTPDYQAYDQLSNPLRLGCSFGEVLYTNPRTKALSCINIQVNVQSCGAVGHVCPGSCTSDLFFPSIDSLANSVYPPDNGKGSPALCRFLFRVSLNSHLPLLSFSGSPFCNNGVCGLVCPRGYSPGGNARLVIQNSTSWSTSADFEIPVQGTARRAKHQQLTFCIRICISRPQRYLSSVSVLLCTIS